MTITIALGVLIVMLVLGAPIAFALGTSGAVGLLLIADSDSVSAIVGAAPFNTSDSYSLVIIPMFIFMGVLAAQGGLAEDVLNLAERVFRRIPGGLGVATIAACAGFAAVTGSSVATVATIARVAVGQMVGYGYSATFAAGIVAIGGTLGVLIPPSILFVVYGIITGESIGALLLAGIIPGIAASSMYAGYIVYRAFRDPESVGRGQYQRIGSDSSPNVGVVRARAAGTRDVGGGRSAGNTETAAVIRPGGMGDPQKQVSQSASMEDVRPIAGFVRIVILFGIVMGGIYSGVVTATEAGALGGLATLILVSLDRRMWTRQYFTKIGDALRETASTTSMIFLILIGASIFALFLIRVGAPAAFLEFVVGMPGPPLLIVGLLLMTLIPLGMFLDGYSILIITVPLIYPVVTELGYDGVWLGVLLVMLIELGLVTPPVGMNAFVLASTVPDISVEQTFRGLIPFMFIQVLTILVIFFVPWFALVLPSMMA